MEISRHPTSPTETAEKLSIVPVNPGSELKKCRRFWTAVVVHCWRGRGIAVAVAFENGQTSETGPCWPWKSRNFAGVSGEPRLA